MIVIEDTEGIQIFKNDTIYMQELSSPGKIKHF